MCTVRCLVRPVFFLQRAKHNQAPPITPHPFQFVVRRHSPALPSTRTWFVGFQTHVEARRRRRSLHRAAATSWDLNPRTIPHDHLRPPLPTPRPRKPWWNRELALVDASPVCAGSVDGGPPAPAGRKRTRWIVPHHEWGGCGRSVMALRTQHPQDTTAHYNRCFRCVGCTQRPRLLPPPGATPRAAPAECLPGSHASGGATRSCCGAEPGC